ncbi:MAG: hypothetical protein QXL15_04870 [Candidatus Korarchaeota archaeon]
MILFPFYQKIFPQIQELLGEVWSFVVWVIYILAIIILLIGAVLWFSDFDSRKGKRLFVGGIVILIIIWIVTGGTW